jgi:glycogen debranching enzyme
MLALVTLAKKHDFELRRLPTARAVLIEDLGFNSMLITANRALEAIASELDEPLPAALIERFRSTDRALETLWDDTSSQYYSRDAVTRELIRVPTIATFLPLWSGTLPAARAEQLIALLRQPTAYWPRFPVPSVALDSPQFEETGYWKGPTWVNTNWMIVEGLRTHGEPALAESLRRHTLDLVDADGCFEYFSALTGAGHGAADFSWTAALTIDLIGDLIGDLSGDLSGDLGD